jgi:undecaprenyl-phosphate galactose phosphotransferase/putative colanic acid biosynthesis UDP-glucose lipid carrier transferase
MSRRVGVPFEVIEPLFAAADCLIILAAGLIGAVLYMSAIGANVNDIDACFGPGLVASLTYALTAHRLDLYRLDGLFDGERDHGRVWTSWSIAILVFAITLFLFKSGAEVSRGSVVCFSLVGAVGLFLWRGIAKRRLHAALLDGAIRGRRAVLIGTQHELAQFDRGDLLVRFGLDEMTRIVLPHNEGAPGLQEAPVGKAVLRVRGDASPEVIALALSWSNPADVEMLADRLRAVPLPVSLLPDHAVSSVLKRQSWALHRSYMVEIQRAPLTAFERTAKRLMDVTIATISLVLMAPLMLICAAAVKIESKGPIIFRQQRHGFNRQPFLIYKFRTMKVLEDGAAVVQAARKDPRVTRVGRFLRQSSIDELPQLFNVLRGDMSIVGPRPHAVVHDHEYGKMIANYAYRHHVKPGITGWAQVQGSRGGTPQLALMERRIALDLWYINNWSVALDIYIIFRTCFELFRQRNAY